MRASVNLHRLPLWLQYAIAIAVSAVVMYFAWLAGRNKPTPGWLPPLMSAWFYIGPGLLAFFVIRWLWRRLGR